MNNTTLEVGEIVHVNLQSPNFPDEEVAARHDLYCTIEAPEGDILLGGIPTPTFVVSIGRRYLHYVPITFIKRLPTYDRTK